MTFEYLTRRQFLKSGATGIPLAYGSSTPSWSSSPVQSHSSPVAPVDTGAAVVFDPLLDTMCRVLPADPATPWKAQWIWYPGQLTARVHAKRMQAAMMRCTQVGYPSSFRQPLSHAYFRRRAVLSQRTDVRWSGPLSRIRLLVNGVEGDITLRKTTIPPGSVELVARIDFAKGIPAFLLEGENTPLLSTNESWESSLDFQNWVPAESYPFFTDPRFLPDQDREITVEIRPRREVFIHQVSAAKSGWQFETGGEIIFDLFHDELGQLAFDLSGQGDLEIQVGESLPEVRDPDPGQPVFTSKPPKRKPVSILASGSWLLASNAKDDSHPAV